MFEKRTTVGQANGLQACVAGSRLPMKSLVFTTLVGTAMVNVPIWNREEKRKRNEDDQWKISFTKTNRKRLTEARNALKLKETTLEHLDRSRLSG